MATRKLGYQGLARKVAREYEADGLAPKTARRIGRATAGKVYHEQQDRKRHRRSTGHHAGCRCRFCTMSRAERLRHLEEARRARRKPKR